MVLKGRIKMKKRFLMMLSIFMITATSACSPVDTIKNKEFGIEILDYPYTESFYTTQKTGNHVTLEMYNQYNLIFYIEDDKFDLHIHDIETKFTLEYPKEKMEINSFYVNGYMKSVQYYLHTKQLFQQETIKITYENQVYDIDIQSIDYDFSKRNETKPSAASLEQDFNAFKEMIDSVQYHSFVSPFPGRNDLGYYSDENDWNDCCTYRYSFKEEYDTSYVDYLIDSVYYPTCFDFASPNMMSKDMIMVYEHATQTLQNASSSRMGSFRVGISVIDPGCTNPTNPLHYMSFEAYPLHYEGDSERIQKNNNLYLSSRYYLLSKSYPERYLSYKVGDITLQIIQIGMQSAQAFFEDGTYAYILTISYNR